MNGAYNSTECNTEKLKTLSDRINKLSLNKIPKNNKFEQFNESLEKNRYTGYQNECAQINNELDKIKLDNSSISQINGMDLNELSTKYLRDKININKDDLNSQKIKLNKNENEKSRIQKQLDDIQITKEKLKKHEYNIHCKYCCNNPFIKKAESEIQNEPILQKQLDTINENIQYDKNQIKLYETLAGLYNLIEIKYNKKIEIIKNSEVVQGELNAYMEYKNNMENSNEADKQIINIENEIKEIQNKLKLKTEIETNIEHVGLQFDIFVSQINSINRLVNELEEVQKNINNNKIISNKLVILKQFYKNISSQSELQNELKVIKDKINILTSNQSIEKHNFEINKNIQNLNSIIKQSNIELSKLQKTETELLITIKNNQNLLTELNQERDKTNTLSNQVNLLSLYCDMCNYNGISNYLSKKILSTIEQTTSTILAKYSNLKINLIDDDDSKELNIKIYRNNLSTGIHAKMLCGSEKFLVELAFRVSLNSLSSISKPNFMICDEGWACLDEITRNNLNFILSAILEHTDYILTVSHIDDVKTWMNKSIYIEIKNNEHFIIQ
jgi:DNA repair exonuclease SbcCD ATPase subunit